MIRNPVRERRNHKISHSKCTHPLIFLLDKRFDRSLCNVNFEGLEISYTVYCYTCARTMNISVKPCESQSRKFHKVLGVGKHRLIEIDKTWFSNLSLDEKIICVDTYSDEVGKNCNNYDDLFVKILMDVNPL